jgi:hypothetical protein
MASVLKEIPLLKGTYEFKERETKKNSERNFNHPRPPRRRGLCKRTWTFMKEINGHSTVEPNVSFCTHSNGFTANSTTTLNFSVY